MKRYVRALIYSSLAYLFLTSTIQDGVLLLYNFGSAVSNTLLLAVLMGVFIVLDRMRTGHETPAQRILSMLVSVVFTTFTVGSICYSTDDLSQTIFTLFCSRWRNRISIILLFAGGILLLYHIILNLPVLSRQIQTAKLPERADRFLFGRRGIFHQALLMLLVLVPQAILFYPGTVGTDAFNSLSQFYGTTRFYTKHPLIYAFTFGPVVDLGAKLGRPNYGLFLYVLLQLVLSVLVVLYTIYVLRDVGVSRLWCAVSFAALTLMPSVFFSIVVVLKDTLFISCFLLLCSAIAWFLFHPDGRPVAPVHVIAAAVGAFGFFYRNNGLLILLVLLCMLALRMVLRQALMHLRPDRYDITLAGAVLAMSVLGQGITVTLNTVLQAETAVSSRVIYSSVIQQFGRTANVHGNELTDRDWADIQRMLDYSREQIISRYNPYNFDPLKLGFRNDLTQEDRKAALQAWLSLGHRYPDTYLASIMHQNLALFSLRTVDTNYGRPMNENWIKHGKEYNYDFSVFFQEKESLLPIQQSIRQFYTRISTAPVLGLLAQASFASLVLFACGAHALAKCRWEQVILLMMPLIILGFTFLGPCIRGNPRYMYPVLWASPLFFGIFLRDLEN